MCMTTCVFWRRLTLATCVIALNNTRVQPLKACASHDVIKHSNAIRSIFHRGTFGPQTSHRNAVKFDIFRIIIYALL